MSPHIFIFLIFINVALPISLTFPCASFYFSYLPTLLLLSVMISSYTVPLCSVQPLDTSHFMLSYYPLSSLPPLLYLFCIISYSPRFPKHFHGVFPSRFLYSPSYASLSLHRLRHLHIWILLLLCSSPLLISPPVQLLAALPSPPHTQLLFQPHYQVP